MKDDKLLQERYVGDPWKFLASHVLLNRVSGKQARRVADQIFRRFPQPEDVKIGNAVELISYLEPLGFQNTRADRLLKLAALLTRAKDELKETWRKLDRADITALPGMGKYAADSYFCFVRGERRLDRYKDPIDKEIRRYLQP